MGKFKNWINDLRDYRGTDGIRRNIGKMIDEFYLVKEGLRDEQADLFDSGNTSHDYVDLYVEGQRISPYFFGHIDAFLWPYSILATIGLIVLWVL